MEDLLLPDERIQLKRCILSAKVSLFDVLTVNNNIINIKKKIYKVIKNFFSEF